jgi:hypothetical protein
VVVHGIVGLSRPTIVAVWRSGAIVGLGFLATSGLRQFRSHLSGLVWRCGSGARRSEAPKVRRSGDRGWAILANPTVWRLGLGNLSEPGGLAVWCLAAIRAGGKGLFDFWNDSV